METMKEKHRIKFRAEQIIINIFIKKKKNQSKECWSVEQKTYSTIDYEDGECTCMDTTGTSSYDNAPLVWKMEIFLPKGNTATTCKHYLPTLVLRQACGYHKQIFHKALDTNLVHCPEFKSI